MNPLFLDANFVIALEIADDQHHREATEYWSRLLKTSFSLVTTSYVLDEIVTFLNSRHHHSNAVKVATNLLNASHVRMIHVDGSCSTKAGLFSSRMRTRHIHSRIASLLC